jgi:predicted nucleotidyltransferase component of viral defense system
VAFELFLRRLAVVGGDQWILKGALALEFRLSIRTRSTKDIDIECSSDERAVIEQLTAAQSLSLDDFFTYTITRTDALDDTDDFSAVRFSVTAELGGRTFERFVLDVAFRGATPSAPETVTTSSFLSFAGIEPTTVPAVAIDQHIAEKVHAYTRTYRGRRSTRPKDLIDIVLIAGDAAVDAQQLRHALERTFIARGTQALPAALPPPPPAWAQPYVRLAREVGVEPELKPAHTLAARFLDPVLSSTTRGEWDPGSARWSDT